MIGEVVERGDGVLDGSRLAAKDAKELPEAQPVPTEEINHRVWYSGWTVFTTAHRRPVPRGLLAEAFSAVPGR